jgi:hypothetical protein
MVLYSCHIFDRQGQCIYHKEWNQKYKKSEQQLEEEYKLIYGMIFSLKQFVSGMAPKEGEGLSSYKTNTYKLHFYESPTGFKFIIITDPNVGQITDHLKHIYRKIFVEYAATNALHKTNGKIEGYLFTQNLQEYVAQWAWFN